jgi:dihydrolipoamide dehydrogenase
VSPLTEVRVPDIGDFTDVPVIEIHVSPGDEVSPEDPLITLESDKATMDVPAPAGGTVTQLSVSIGDRVSEGSVLLTLEGGPDGAGESADVESSARGSEQAPAGDAATQAPAGDAAPRAPAGDAATQAPAGDSATQAPAGDAATRAPAGEATTEAPPPSRVDAPQSGVSGADGASAPAAPAPPPSPAVDAPDSGASGDGGRDAQVVVIGSGPGGYSAAFRAADLGLKTVLIERYDTLGGVCLNVGCIPSKALLHAARVVAEAEEMSAHGIHFDKPSIDLDALRSWKESAVGKLTGGLEGLARQRKVEVIHGVARFTGANSLEVADRTVTFDNCIIAAGSSASSVPGLPEDPRIVHSTGALEIEEVPQRLLVIGGGIIGLEMATVYDALGSTVTVVEMLDQLLSGCDPDVVRPLHKRIAQRYEAIHLKTKVESVEADDDGLRVKLSNGDSQSYDRILVAVGRKPNGGGVDAGAAGVRVDDVGFIPVDRQLRTNVSHIHAIGDVVGGPMLAHKASHEGKTAAEVIAGVPGAEFDPRSIPSVAYTDPEVAWTGLTETAARADGVEYEKAVFPWGASGRALGLARPEGLTKLLFEPRSHRLLGAGIVGVNAGELIAETAHALEMGSDAEDIGLTIHPHPTLTETVAFAAEMEAGTITDLVPPGRSRR